MDVLCLVHNSDNMGASVKNKTKNIIDGEMVASLSLRGREDTELCVWLFGERSRLV